jgi:site-specific DNA-methyltransferase (adenine-specific)
MELRTLCRKPLSEKNIAENILKWWTWWINIDGCRVWEEKITINRHEWQSNSLVESTKGEWEGKQEIVQWRYPANFIHDGSDEVVSLFPNSKGSTQSKAIKNTGSSWKNSSKEIRWTTYNDDGSASRFFYCWKASKSEKNKWLDGFEEKRPDTRTSTGMWVFEEKWIANYHPTVKPVKLMRYLCRLVTPVWWIVLDPFMWSWTTGIGAKLEWFDFIGIEKEEEYFNIAQARIDAW